MARSETPGTPAHGRVRAFPIFSIASAPPSVLRRPWLGARPFRHVKPGRRTCAGLVAIMLVVPNTGWKIGARGDSPRRAVVRVIPQQPRTKPTPHTHTVHRSDRRRTPPRADR